MIEEMKKSLLAYCNETPCRFCIIEDKCHGRCQVGNLRGAELRECYERVMLGGGDAAPKDAKADAGKPTPTLVPREIIYSIERVRKYGVEKYHDPYNWRRVDADRYWEALIRHVLAAWYNYRAVDAESGLMHLEHIACNAAFILELIKEADHDD